MVACPEPDTFNALLAGQLAGDARAHVLDHAASCDECHALIDSLMEVTVGTAGPVLPASPPQERVGRYVIERRIGAGAMGIVYAARDPELERRVAIKVLRGGGSAVRLKREAQMLARLHHPNVVAVHDVGVHDGQTFVAMALVDGENLRAWLARPHDTREILRVLDAAAAGLEAAHAADLIHRDLKPDNIFVANDGSVQVGDFGLARSDGEVDPAASTSGALDLTQTGMVVGTPAYMAPEHADGEPTAASDQFGFCVTAWEALFGARPFAAKTYAELRDKIDAHDFAPVPEDRHVPARVRAALERGLAADPAQRFPSIAALRAALAPPRRVWPWLAGGGVAIAAGVTAIVLTRHAPDPCARTAHDLDAVWTPAVRDKLAPARTLLDGYTRDWLALRRDACVAGNELRTRCLDHARDALRELAAAGDPELVQRGALALPPLDECKTPLQGSASPDLVVRGEELAGEISALGVRLAFAGNDALPRLHELSARADQLGYAPAIVDAAIVESQMLARALQTEAAEAKLRHALSIAEASHDDLRVARVATALARTLLDLGKVDETRAIVELAIGALARSGGSTSLEIDLASVRAKLASASGDHESAIEIAQKLLASMIARTGPDSEEVASLHIMLSREYAYADRVADAQREADAARLSDLARVHGDPTGGVLATSGKLNQALLAGDTDRAIALGRELVALARELHEPSVEVEAAMSLASAYEVANDFRGIVDAYGAALALPDLPPAVRGQALEGLGRGWHGLHHDDKALAPLRQAVEIDAAGGAALVDQHASAATALGEVLVDGGKPHDARVLIEPVVRALADLPDLPAQRRAGAELVLARALWDDGGAGDRERARTLADDAIAHYRAAIAKLSTTYPIAVPRFEKKLAAAVAWRQHRG